jgi:hypothetical protein
MDPRIRIRTKMSWIRNTAKNSDLPVGEYPLPKLDVLVVPRSFSGLGLASPNLTFISPSLLAGDPSLLGRAPPLLSYLGILVLLQVYTSLGYNDFNNLIDGCNIYFYDQFIKNVFLFFDQLQRIRTRHRILRFKIPIENF